MMYNYKKHVIFKLLIRHKLVQAWMEIHKDELVADWELAVSGEQPYKIEPLR
jgi:hypothetical protein